MSNYKGKTYKLKYKAKDGWYNVTKVGSMKYPDKAEEITEENMVSYHNDPHFLNLLDRVSFFVKNKFKKDKCITNVIDDYIYGALEGMIGEEDLKKIKKSDVNYDENLKVLIIKAGGFEYKIHPRKDGDIRIVRYGESKGKIRPVFSRVCLPSSKMLFEFKELLGLNDLGEEEVEDAGEFA